jgi:hypothetical protein
MTDELSEEERYYLGQLVGLHRQLLAVSKNASDTIESEGACSLLDRSSAVLIRSAKISGSERVEAAASRTARVASAARVRSVTPTQELVRRIGDAALSIGIGALLGAAFAGPYVAMALQQEVGQKVVEAAIGGAIGAGGGVAVDTIRAPRDQARDARLAELEANLKRLNEELLPIEPSLGDDDPFRDLDLAMRQQRDKTKTHDGPDIS